MKNIQKMDVYKLTNPQKNIWNIEQYYKGTAINNICGSVVIKEKIDLEKLSKAINIFIENNDSFKTRITLIDGEPHQYFIENKTYKFEIIEIKDIQELKSYANNIVATPLKIIESQLFDFKIFKLSNNFGGFIINAHHIISDAATFGLIGSEVTSNYLKLKNNEEIENKNYHYSNYIEAEQKYLESSRFIQDKKYWNELFLSIPTIATIPSYKTNSEDAQANRLECSFSKKLISDINKYCKINKVSIYNFLFAVYSIYIGKINHTDNFIMGTPVLNRSNFAQKHTSGLFITTSLQHINTNYNLAFIDFLHNIARRSMSMLKHQKYDYQYILNDVRKQNKDITSLYDIMLSYQITKATDTNINISYDSTWYMTPYISNSMNIHFHDNNDTGKLFINYDYKISKYEEKDIQNIHNRVVEIIKQVLKNPNIKVNNIQILTKEEKNKVIYEFNNTHKSYPKEKTLVELFEKQVNTTPDKCAVVFGDTCLTYKDLNEKANSLARFLRDNKKINKNDLVGIMLNRSIEMVIAILAVLKAGGAYIPIDPSYPKDRIDYMLKNSEAKALLIQEEIQNKIKFKNSVVVNLNNIEIYDTNYKINLEHVNTPEDLAYVIFTSGSTGMPKGVMLKHSNIVNFVYGMMREFNFLNSKTIVSLTTISFDIFVLESLMPLLNGLKVVIANEDEQTDVKLFNKLCNKNKVDIIQTTPSRMQLFMQNADSFDFIKNATHILIGGEPFPEYLLSKLKDKTSAKIYNMYGPTETAVWSTFKNLTNEKYISIGKPINNTQIYILDTKLNPVPIGIAGEIYISGDGVSKGYLKNTELTKTVFLTNPFKENTLMYKTGDLGYYLENGDIICLGRIDNQVKIRGLRIELGEIENKINNLPYINNCVVVKNEDQQGKEYLCTYFTANTVININEIRNYLENVLPKYMIPNYFMQLKDLPYTPNGKIDRNRLPKPEYMHNKKIIKPRNNIDLKLIDIYKKILKLNAISIDDDFFEVGGDSLSAINLCTYIQDKLEAKLYVRDIVEHPTIKEQSDIIEKRSSKNKRSINDNIIIEKAKNAEYYETSSAQKRLYYSNQILGSNSVAYNISGGVIFDGNIDKMKLESCIQILIDRHEAFRTFFEVQNKKLVQKIKENIAFKLEVLEEAEFKDKEKIFKKLVQPFNLSIAPLFKAKYIQFTNGKSALFIDMHHIISDGASISIFIKELSDLYNGKALPNISITYKDYSNYENKKIINGQLKSAENYWINKFSDDIPVLNLPTNYTNTDISAGKGKKIHFVINSSITDKIKQTSKKLGITPYMMLLSCYYILLSKYTEQDDIVIGSPIENREMLETLNIIGMFVNTLPLREKINREDSFKNFALQVKDNLLDAFKYQEYPLNELVDKLNVKRNLTKNPLFNVLFTYQNNGFTDLNFNSTKSKLYIPDSDISKFDLSLEAIPNNSEIELCFEYATNLFENDFIKNMSNHFINILNNVLENMDIKISEINMLSKQETNKIENQFNNTATIYPSDKTVVKLFEEQVKKTPNNTAVVFKNEKISYKELNEKANKFANYLAKKGIPQNSIVPVIMDRSIDLIISMISIIKIGAVYLPISIDMPTDRINYILKDSEAKFIITDKNIDFIPNENIINIKEVNYSTYKVQNVDIIINPSDLLYIIYTSGSTGNPKGVKVTHKNLINLVYSFNKLYETISEKDRLLASTSISFDVSMFEFYISLLNGCTLYLYDEVQISDIFKYCKSLIDKKITFAYIPPNLLETVEHIISSYGRTSLDKLLLGVEPIKSEIVKRYYRLNPKMKIINAYGPTEATICATAILLTPTILNNYNTLPIGKPLNNLKIYILDKNRHIVPIGIPGELYIAGDNVSKGYLNNSNLTKKSFITIPNLNQKCVYKTGDIAKWDKNGIINFIGRNDNQIKINGHRIELGEIENCIYMYPGINKVIAILNNNKIICYFSANEKIEEKKLREFLKTKLPLYFIPNLFIQVEKFELTANGKIDRKKLPEPKCSVGEQEKILPRNSIEAELVKMFESVLNISIYSVQNSFFEYGGDSLSAINLCVKIKDKYNVQLYVKDILENPTVQDLVEIIKNKDAKLIETEIQPVKDEEFYDVSFAQKRIYYASKIDGNNSILYNIAGGVIFDKYIDTKKLEECFIKLINRHETLRTYFEVCNGKVIQKILDRFDFKIEIQEEADFQNIDKYFHEFVKPFDLSVAPLLRAKCIKFINGKSAIFIDIHHIISDGISMEIFINELFKIYNGETLQELTISYKDFSTYENNKLMVGKLKESEEYWVKQFSKEVPVLNMPTKQQRPAVQDYEGNKIHAIINANLSKKIKDISNKLEITPYMMLLACYYILLAKYTSQNDIVIGSPIANRTLSQTKSLIGMFVNTLALRNNVDGKASFKEFVMQVKENLLQAYKHQEYPFDELINKLNIKRDPSRNPLFDTMFIYQNKGYEQINIDDMKAQIYTPDVHTSKFDLSLEAIPINNEINLSFEYATKLFDEKFIKDLSNHYINILTAVAENIDKKIDDINVLSKEEYNKILFSFNDTFVDYPKDKTIVKLFEEQVEKTPDNIALVVNNQELTYKQLNEKANSLARFLRYNEKVNRNDLVGIMVNRSFEMIIAIFAVLKAGGAYIPIDPTYPKDRINYMLKNSNAKLLLTKKQMESKVDFKNIISIDLNNVNIYSMQTDNLKQINNAQDLAYVIFTSGSTGKPKGVMLKNNNIVNFIYGMMKEFKFDMQNVIVSLTTISFDIFILESLMPLLNGLKIILANEEEQTNIQAFNRLCLKHNVNIIQTTPSRMQIFLQSKDNLECIKNATHMLIGGEAFPKVLLQKLKQISNAKIYNMYGPTETAVWSTVKELTNSNNITIGKPISNTQVYILDRNLQPLPIGVPGDIYISGEGVSKGYLNKLELTKKSFMPNPYIPNTVMYKTGDIGLYNLSGEIICLGRQDNQVKIRGLRIELEEIEMVIQKYQEIEKAIVVKQSINGRDFIFAYYLATKTILVKDLKKYVSKFLPGYMRPSYYVLIEDVPYTPNGKVDKKALPLPSEILDITKQNYIAPKTKLQMQIEKIWEKVLNTKHIGINDNFFELGGDSLLAMTLNLELAKTTKKVSYQDIFRYPTIAELEEKIKSKSEEPLFNKIQNLSESLVEILKDCTIPKKINRYHPKGILLTGATGFLGIHILEQFIKNEKGNIYCIVRDGRGVTSTERLYQKLNYYFGNKYNGLINKRIFAITGNITQPGFGLNQDELLKIANSVDLVINSAANVFHFGNYKEFYNTNVKSVKYMIDFCKSFNKKLYHISTVSVADESVDLSYPAYDKKTKIIFDESSLYIGQPLENVYSRTKFEAETYVLNAINQNLDGYILRMGHLTPRISDGVFQENVLENDLLSKIASFMKIGIFPDYLLKHPIEITPVDQAAKAVYKLITHPNNSNRIFHLFNNNVVYPYSMIKILKKLNYNIHILPEDEFKNRINDILNNEEKSYLLKKLINDFDNDLHFNYKTDIIIKSEFTIKYLRKIFFKWKKISYKYLVRFIKLIGKEI